jgi:hypothetical protein
MTKGRERDDEEIVFISDISNENISDLSSSDSYYEISDADDGEGENGTSHSDSDHE